MTVRVRGILDLLTTPKPSPMEFYNSVKDVLQKATEASRKMIRERDELRSQVQLLETKLSSLEKEHKGCDEYILELETALEQYEVGIQT